MTSYKGYPRVNKSRSGYHESGYPPGWTEVCISDGGVALGREI